MINNRKRNYLHLFAAVIIMSLSAAGFTADDKQTVDYLSTHELVSEGSCTADIHKAAGSLPEQIILTFTKNGNYNANVIFGQWGFTVKGPYAVKKGQITLTIDDETKKTLNKWLVNEKPDRYNKYYLKNGVIVDDNESVKYSRYLKFDDGTKFWDKSTLITKEGLPKKINSVQVTTMGMKKGITKSNVKLREKADAGSKEKRYCKDPEMGPCTNYVPKGEAVVIIARTEKKMKVQQWENFWYYVEFSGTIGEGWIFGEFLEME